MNFIRFFIRFAGVVSIASIITGYSKWPEFYFISSCVMILIWIHAEWDWYRKK